MRRATSVILITLLTAAAVDMLFGPSPYGGWALPYVIHQEQAIQAHYGVNGWIYLFLWWIAAAPLWWYGLHLAITGVEKNNLRRMWAGITLNRIGTLLAPAYILIAGRNLPWVATALVVLLPVAFSAYFGIRLKDPIWRAKNEKTINFVVTWWHRLVFMAHTALIMVLYRLAIPYIWWQLRRGSEFTIRVAESDWEKESVAALERQVFLDEKYPYPYAQYDSQSVLIGAWDGDQIVGALRLIAGGPLAPPVLAECDVPDQIWHTAAADGLLEELGTVAVHRGYRGRFVAPRLYRVALASSRARGVTHWALIMEPDRVETLNRKLSINLSAVDVDSLAGYKSPSLIVRFG